MLPNSWLSAIIGVIGAAVMAMFGWLARHTIKRVDDLERHSVTREEFEKFCESRERSDEQRGEDIHRLEGKIDGYHQSISERIDRLLEARNGGR